MSNTIRLGLVVYFSVIIIGSLFILIFIWNPVQGSLIATESETRNITDADGKNKTIIKVVKNSNLSSETRSTTSIMETKDGRKMTNETVLVRPLTGQAFNTDPELVFTNPEIRLVMFAVFFGVIGASVHGIGSLTAWISTRKLEAGWGIWYLTRPPIGAALAIITYLVLRAGFVTGGPTAISDFGVAGLSALVGLMTDEMTTKLRDIFDTLFGIKKPEVEKGESTVKRVVKGIELSAEKTSIRVGENSKMNAKLKKKDGTPAKDVVTNFTLKDSSIIGFTGDSNPKTDNNGNATVEIQGKKTGETSLSVRATIEGQIEQDDITITVI
jgi:hypothetical protein